MDPESSKRQRLFRFAIPAAVCLAVLIAFALGTKVLTGFGPNQAQPMDLRGQWLGMRLASTDSRNAADLGVPAEIKGVVVADVQVSSRAVLAGLAPGDVVTGVDGKDVATLIDLYAISTKLDVARQLQLDILRGGRPMIVMVPPPEAVAPGSGAQWNGARPLFGAGAEPGWSPNGRTVPALSRPVSVP